MFAIVFWRAFGVAIGGKGIKRRLEEAQGDVGEAQESAHPSGSSSSAPTGRRSGGVRQRIAASIDAPSASTTGGSTAASREHLPLFEGLKQDWARGQVSSKKVLERLQGAIDQGARGLGFVENMGTHNAYRTLMTAFGKPVGAPDFTWAEIPLLVDGKETMTAHPFFMPHDFFKSYARERAGDFQSTMTGPRGACAQFWEGIRGSVFFRSHPRLSGMDLSKTIPLGLHGDAGPFTKTDSLFVISWNSLVGRGATAKKRFVFTVLRKSEMQKTRTLEFVWKIFAWSMNTMLSGVMPTLSWDGRPLQGGGTSLADGWCGAMCQVRGDWDFYREVFQFPQWNCNERMCFMCQASSTTRRLAWTQLGPDAGWRDTRWTHESYLAFLVAAAMFVPTLLTAVTGLRLECIMIDVLHAVDLGITSHIIGNVFWLIAIRRNAFGCKNNEDRIKKLNEHMVAWYKRAKCESKVQGKLNIDRVRTSGGWPKLKAKAAATRHLAAYALFLVQVFGAEEDKHVLALCTLLCEFYQILNDEPMYLGATAKARLPVLGQQLAVIYSKLAETSANARLRMWKMSPKLHLFVHLCEWQAMEWGNPRYFWCYADEDLVGILTEVAKSCHPSTLAVSALFKWLHVYFE